MYNFVAGLGPHANCFIESYVARGTSDIALFREYHKILVNSRLQGKAILPDRHKMVYSSPRTGMMTLSTEDTLRIFKKLAEYSVRSYLQKQNINVRKYKTVDQSRAACADDSLEEA